METKKCHIIFNKSGKRKFYVWPFTVLFFLDSKHEQSWIWKSDIIHWRYIILMIRAKKKQKQTKQKLKQLQKERIIRFTSN